MGSSLCSKHNVRIYLKIKGNDMKTSMIRMSKDNRKLRIGFGKYEGSWFFRIDLWFVGFRISQIK